MIRTVGSFGSGKLSRVALAGMKNCTRQLPAPAAVVATGAVIAILSLVWATGAVMAMLAALRLPPKIYPARRRNPSLRAAVSLPAATVVSAASRGP